MHVRQTGPGTWRVDCPAKLNLFLEVIRKRPDGFHEIDSVMAAVNLCDTLEFTDGSPGASDSLWCRWAAPGDPIARAGWGELPARESNLAWRALQLVRKHSDTRRSASVAIRKRIPAAAGLGGASSNAAGVLAAANRAWNLGWSAGRLAEVAAELGSDVPFFLAGGAGRATGRGEHVRSLEGTPDWWFVLAKPKVGLSTAEVYRACVPAETTNAPRSCEPIETALRTQRLDLAVPALFNRLMQPAMDLAPAVADTIRSMRRAGTAASLMSGSGSSVFGLCRNWAHARSVASRMRSQLDGFVSAARIWRPPRGAVAA